MKSDIKLKEIVDWLEKADLSSEAADLMDILSSKAPPDYLIDRISEASKRRELIRELSKKSLQE